MADGIVASQHYVTFYSPGTLVHETSTKEIDSWDVQKAREMAKGVMERHGATPFAFRFITKGRKTDDLDSKEIASSGRYYLGGKIETVKDIEARNDPEERILLSNMRGNGWDRVVTTTNGYRVTQPLNEDDVVLS